jgi:mono/diheme cytochrome c family protein
MAGGLPFETPFGTIYSTNITADPETGIGGWTAGEFIDSMRYGVRPGGEHLYPVFPYTAFTKASDDDILAIFAYLRSLPAVRQPAPGNDLDFPFGFRPLLAFWKALFFDAGAWEPDPAKDDSWNRGAYLVEALAHCSACHSPRNLLGAERTDRAMSGGEYLDRVLTGEYRPWYAPNLTSAERGLGSWSHDDLSAYLKTARSSFLESFGPMNEVIMNSTRHLDQSDVDAMARYLKSLPAIAEDDAPAPDARTMGRGRTVYNLHCGTCHLPTGEGDPEMAPKLNRGSLVVQADNPASMINVILYSPEAPHPPLPVKWRVPMEEFQYKLDDEEIAAVASFIRNSWDNSAGIVTPDRVARQR